MIPMMKTGKKKALAKEIERSSKYGAKMGSVTLKKFTHGSAPNELIELETKLLQKSYKFGVLYCAANQTIEEEMFGNGLSLSLIPSFSYQLSLLYLNSLFLFLRWSHLLISFSLNTLHLLSSYIFQNFNSQTAKGSPEFEEFLELLGDKIELRGFHGFRGGLDVVSNATGTHSIYTSHLEHEIMFHVSTLLPHNPQDEQQVVSEFKRYLESQNFSFKLEKKRHLGNDVCVIIFKDSAEPFSPDMIKSEFNRILSSHFNHSLHSWFRSLLNFRFHF
jgi:hypothetical protein